MQSMTAYARSEMTYQDMNLICEMRSVNHRYLELNMNLPDSVRAFEMSIRDMVRSSVRRGKVDLSLRIIFQGNMELSLNESALESLKLACQHIKDIFITTADINPLDILKFPLILDNQIRGFEQLPNEIEELIEKTLDALVISRSREGQAIKEFIIERLQKIKLELAKIYNLFPETLELWKDKIRKKLNDSEFSISQDRLEQELVLYSQRIDIAEECSRLSVHLDEMQRVLTQDEAIGRRLDFLTQELNREANTIGSKSMHAGITHAAVEIKVLIEQIREQIQNIE